MAGGKAEGTSTPVSHTLHMETQTQPPPPPPPPLRKIISVASIAVGIQFGWALQISLLTPYVQLLGIPHKWASLIWLCGPISGLIVQPIAGHFSDRSTSRFGRRRPFLALGSLLVTVAVFLIGYAADLGHLLGDSLSKTPKTRAIAIFALGFWILDIANYMLGGPCRAFLADLAAGSESKTRTANAFFTFFTALGSVLGYSTGMYTRLHEIFPFTLTAACDVYCANLKSCFFLSITLLLIITVATLLYVNEDKPWSPCDNNADNASDVPFIGEILRALKGIKRPMWILMIVTALNWLAVTPFLLFNTDWMGREVYGGDPTGNAESKGLYNAGVSAGALGLLLNAIVVGFMSLCVEWIGRKIGGAKRLWGATNLVMAVCLVMMVPVTKLAEAHRRSDAGAKTYPAVGVRAAALALFGLLGIPQAVTLSIPYAMASIFSSNSGVGQGLSQGVLNLAIVTPQMVVSLGGGPIDQLFGGGNLPLYVVAAIAATTAGVLAFTFLPSPSPEKTTPLPRH